MNIENNQIPLTFNSQLNQFISEITLGELTIFGKQDLDKLIGMV